MKSVLYICHNEVQLVAYSKLGKDIRIEKVAYINLSETAVINGIITDSNEVKDKLQVLYDENKKYFKNLRLVLDSSSIMIKKMPVPKMRKWQYEKLIEDELGEVSKEESNLIFDYIHIAGESDVRNILACGVERELISSYLEIFNNIGIKIKSVQVGFEGIVDYIPFDNRFTGKTAVLNILDGYSLLSIIFQNGELIFWKRSRVLAEDNEEMVSFLLNEISSFIQFTKSEKLTPITEFYYIGASKGVLEGIKNENLNSGITISNFDIPDNIKNSRMLTNKIALVLFSVLCKTQEIDFYKEYKKPKKKAKVRKGFKPSYLTYPVIILMFIGGYFYLKYDTSLQEEKIEISNRYLINEQVLSDLEEAKRIQNDIKQRSKEIKSLADYEAMINAFPEVTDGVFNHIMTSAGNNVIVENINFDASKKTILLKCVGLSENDGNNYIYKLKADKKTNNVEYTGYKIDELGKYGFDVKILLTNKEGE